MKKKFGLEITMLASICLFFGSNCLAQQPDPGSYRVYKATGGHMEKGDNFEISEDSEIQYLVPGVDGDDVDIKERWNATNEPQGRWLLTHHQSFVCGFIKIDTDDHKGNKFGHSAVHGILIRRIGNPGDGHIQIKWSAHPLTSIPGEGDRANKCIDIDTPHHGGIAHARQ